MVLTNASTATAVGGLQRRVVLGGLAAGIPMAAARRDGRVARTGPRSLGLTAPPGPVGLGGSVGSWSVVLRDESGARVAGSHVVFRVVSGPDAVRGQTAGAWTVQDGVATVPRLEAGSVPGRVVVAVVADHAPRLDVDVEVGTAPNDIVAWGLFVGAAATTITRVPALSLASRPGLTAAVRTDGSVVHWVTSPATTSPAARVQPRLAQDWTEVVALSLAPRATAALHRDGSISWARPGARPRTIPTVVGATNVVASADGMHVLDADGTIWAWGSPAGQVGAPSWIPSPIRGVCGAVSLAASRGTVYALESNGEVWGWGDGTRGQLGPLGSTEVARPMRLDDDAVAVATGRATAFALTGSGAVLGWGAGVADAGVRNGSSSPTPRVVASLPALRSLAAADRSACGVDEEGRVWSWGRGNEGQRGDGTTAPRSRAAAVPGLVGVRSVVTDGRTTHAIC